MSQSKIAQIVTIRKDLEGDYLQQFTKELGELITSKHAAEYRKKVVAADVKKVITNADERITKMTQAISQGFDLIDMRCTISYDRTLGLKYYHDELTNEIVKKETIKPEEQLELYTGDNSDEEEEEEVEIEEEEESEGEVIDEENTDETPNSEEDGNGTANE